MTVYANLVNGTLQGVYDLLPQTWEGIENFHLKCKVDEDFMKANGFVMIVRDTTPFDSATHRMSDFPYYTVENGEVIEHRDILEISQPAPEDPQPAPEETPTTP